MYKILTKLHTVTDNVWRFHMVENDEGEEVEYQVATPKAAAEQALTLLGRVGYEDLRIVDDQSYYLDLIYGKKPPVIENYYTITYENIEGYEPDREVIERIPEGATVSSIITFNPLATQFHLIVDDKEYKTGNPNWITFGLDAEGNTTITYSGITRDHTVEIVIDETMEDEPDLSI